jgi:DedD protein
MAFFKFRTGAHDSPEDNGSDSETRTVENLRRRARQRLIGAAVLVVLAVAGFPLVFDTQPRPVPSDLAIDIPSKAKQASEVPPAPLSAHSGAAAQATGAAAPAEPHDPKQSLTEKEELVSSDAKSTPAVSAPVAKPAAGKVDPVKPEAVSNANKATAEARFVVQVGSYGEDVKVREVRAKLEKAGLKTYVQVIETKEGKRTRVRLVPFATKDEADKAAEKVKSMQLPALVLNF